MIMLLQFLVGLVASLLDKAFQMDQAYSGRHHAKATLQCDLEPRGMGPAGVRGGRGGL